MNVSTCSVCGRPRWSKHAEVCPGPPAQSARELAQAIVDGEAYQDSDAALVAHALLRVSVAGPVMGGRNA